MVYMEYIFNIFSKKCFIICVDHSDEFGCNVLVHIQLLIFCFLYN
jgi:hypothetical protein